MKKEMLRLSEKQSTDRRTLKTKKAVCNALSECLQEKELHKITVQEIVDKADISRVTFYKYYLDVYDLYDQIEHEKLLSIGLIVLELDNINAEEFFKHLVSYIYDNRATFVMIFSPNATSRLKDKLSRIIEGTLQKIYSEKLGVDIDAKDLSYICRYRSSGFLSVIQKWIQDGFKEPCDSIVKMISSLDRNVEQYFLGKKL